MYGDVVLKKATMMRTSAYKKLLEALRNNDLTMNQATKVYEDNFDKFISLPLIQMLELDGIYFMGDVIKTQGNGKLTLPNPKPVVYPHKSILIAKNTQESQMDQEEADTLASNLFIT